MIEELKKLRSKIKIGIVGGSDMAKQYEQLGKTGKTFWKRNTALFRALLFLFPLPGYYILTFFLLSRSPQIWQFSKILITFLLKTVL